jgi:hypothetical protein
VLGLIKDYDLEVHYHPGKANIVADALVSKSQCNCLAVKPGEESIYQELEKTECRTYPTR